MRLATLFALTFLFGVVAAAPRDKAGVTETDIATLQGRMSSGALSSRELTRAYLERIAAIDDNVFEIRIAFIQHREKSRQAARPVARRADPAEGQHRRNADGQFGRLACPRQPSAEGRRLPRR